MDTLQRRSAGAVCIIIVFSLAACKDTTPVPKNGYNTEKIDYSRAHPEAKVVALGVMTLDQKVSTPPPRGMMATFPKGELLALEGTIVHPDNRFEACLTVVELTRTMPDDKKETVFTRTAVAKGKGGKLQFRIETKVPKNITDGVYGIRVYVETYQPGQDPKGEPVMWKVDACTGEVALK